MERNEEQIDIISSLIEKLKDSEDFYRTAAHNVTNDSLRDLFQARTQERSNFATELEAALRQLDGEEEIQGTFREGFLRGLMTVRAAMMIERNKTNEVVINECNRHEEELLATYEEVLARESLSPRLHALVEEQSNQLQASYSCMDTAARHDENPVIVALFATIENVEQAVTALQAAGIQEDQIGILAQEEVVREALENARLQTARESAGAAAIGGGALGGILGLVAGASTALVAGVGTVLTGGALAAVIGLTAAGVGIGASYGGFLGTLLGWGIAEDDTHLYIEGVRRGEILMTVQTSPQRTEEVMDILRQAHGQGVATRHEEFDEVFDRQENHGSET